METHLILGPASLKDQGLSCFLFSYDDPPLEDVRIISTDAPPEAPLRTVPTNTEVVYDYAGKADLSKLRLLESKMKIGDSDAFQR